MTKKLYVDFFSADNSMAVVTNQQTITYNLIVLDRFNDQSSPGFSIGKYIFLIMAKEDNTAQMLILDLRKNPDVAKDIVNSPEMSASTKQRMASLIETYNATYKSDNNEIELIKGFPPAIVK